MAHRARRRIDATRRAEIGAAKRLRTRTELLVTALDLFGRPHGRNTRIEDLCAHAGVARGTFYNYFTGLEAVLEALSDALTRDFDSAVHASFAALRNATERTAAAVRYYLHAPLIDPRWGWAIVNSSVGHWLYGEHVARHVIASLQEGIDSGEFSIESAIVGRDIVLGTGMSATITLLGGKAPQDYPEQVARQVLVSLGAPPVTAAKVTGRPMRELPMLAMNTSFFRGTLGGADHSRKPPPAGAPRRRNAKAG
jgi:AcrR family transcriptional regulator